MRVAVIGGVASTETLVQALVRHHFEEIKVWGYEPAETSQVSGWRDLRHLAGTLALPFEGFRKVTECAGSLNDFSPDLLFVVGLSQIVPKSMLSIARNANIGFHPTALPRGRGRAALAWLILHGEHGAATFFKLSDLVDEGPLFAQEPYIVNEQDDAAGVEAKLLLAERRALDRWLPLIKQGNLQTTEQDHTLATWLGRRTPLDGWLDWQASRRSLLKLIRASAPPHPGAFTFCNSTKILVLQATLTDRPETGVPGRILQVHPDGTYEVQAGDGILHVQKWQSESEWKPRVGILLGYYTESEIFNLRQRVDELEHKVVALQALMGKEEQ